MAVSTLLSGPLSRNRWLTLALIGFCIPTNAETPPEKESTPRAMSVLVQTLLPTRATYRATYRKGIPINGTATRVLEQQADGQWNYRFEVRSLMLDITETVRFEWTGRRVRPFFYTYDRDTWRTERHGTVAFDWDQLTVTNNIEDKPWHMAIPDDALDKLGYQLQLRMDLAAGQTTMTYRIADGGKLKENRFAVVGEETLRTEHGQVPTLIVERLVKPGSKRRSRLWMAKDWHFLLVQMLQKEIDGEIYEIFLESASIGDLTIGQP